MRSSLTWDNLRSFLSTILRLISIWDAWGAGELVYFIRTHLYNNNIWLTIEFYSEEVEYLLWIYLSIRSWVLMGSIITFTGGTIAVSNLRSMLHSIISYR